MKKTSLKKPHLNANTIQVRQLTSSQLGSVNGGLELEGKIVGYIKKADLDPT